MLKGRGLNTPAQVRRVVLSNPQFLFLRSERNLKSKLSLLSTFFKEEDISKLVCRNAIIFSSSENTLKSRISFLQRLGIKGEVLSHLVGRSSGLFMTSEEKVIELFKQVEIFGFEKGSKSFADAVDSISRLRKETLERKLQCLRSLGFSEKKNFEFKIFFFRET